jgi:ATP-dependent exoDNAse (exonuclease V) beta subunit
MNDLEKFNSIIFDETNHRYFLNGQELTSTTTIIKKKIEQPFDRIGQATKKSEKTGVPVKEILKEWDEAGKTGREKGTNTHLFIEETLKELPTTASELIPEMLAFTTFWDRVKEVLKPIKVEWNIGDKELGIGGTIDFFCYSSITNKYHILDWKTGKFELESPFGFLKEPFNDLSVASFNKYSLQLSIYRLILERNIQLSIGHSYIIHLNSEGGCETYQALDLRDRAGIWLKGL